jgi:hypothetical protein
MKNNSSLVTSWSLDAQTGELTLVLRTGTMVYSNSPDAKTSTFDVADGLLAAESKGKYFNAVILKSGLPYKKI